MAAFRSGIRWADMTTDSFSASKTATGVASAVLQQQIQRADMSYALGDDCRTEFENSNAGLNQYFKNAAALASTPPLPTKPSNADKNVSEEISWRSKLSVPNLDAENTHPRVIEVSPKKNVPGFKGLLVSTPADKTASSSPPKAITEGSNNGTAWRRPKISPSDTGALASTGEMSESVGTVMTPAKRNRRTSGISAVPSIPVNTDVSPSGTGAEASGDTSAWGVHQENYKRRKCPPRRSADGSARKSADAVPSGATSRGGHSKHSGQGRRLSDRKTGSDSFATDANRLMQIGLPFLQLPGLVSPVFMSGFPGGGGALPGMYSSTRVPASSVSKDTEEEWQKRESARMKDIAIGKATTGYRHFLRSVGKEHRTDADPSTPDPKERSSKAQFQRVYQIWRKQLHKYDDPQIDDASTPPRPSPSCPVASEEGATDQPDTKDLDAISAFNKECELAGF